MRRSSEIKPSDINDLKVKTQQLQLKIRQARSQHTRIQDQIHSLTNTINRTFERQSDKPPVTASYTNAIQNLQKTIDGQKAVLAKLRAEIDKAKEDDKTFLALELKEEVKLAYAENVRLTTAFKEHKEQEKESSRERTIAEFASSQQHITEVRATIKDLKLQNKGSKEKINIYGSKYETMRVDSDVAAKSKDKTPLDQRVQNANDEIQQVQDKIKEIDEQLDTAHQDHLQKVQELDEIYQQQLQKVRDALSGQLGKKGEEEDNE